MSRTFSHSGDLGDVIYGLPTIRALGGGSLWLRKSPVTRLPMTAERVPEIAELLETQDYVEACIWNEDGVADFRLDAWRRYVGSGMNIAEMHLEALGLSLELSGEPWIQVDPMPAPKVLMHRTDRYANPTFPWKDVLQAYGSDLAMVGFPGEHEAFVKEFGKVPFIFTATLLDLARVIAGCALFVGNQSAPLAFAEAMKKDIVHEVCLDPTLNNCVFIRKGRMSYTEGALTLPPLRSNEEA